ncbi:MAG: hypothetical protein KDD03_12840, partial [Gelidibacter sp.]|nr:hypothetical protein [Gelidibacter sp.]
MKTKLTVVIIMLFCGIQVNSQTRQQVFGSIQKLVSKTEGQKVKSNNVFAKKDDKLGKQVFNEKVISVNKIPEGKSSYEWVYRATEISWNDFFDYLVYTEFNNDKLQVVRLNFNKSFKKEHFTNDNDSDTSPSTSDYFEFYVLTSDEDELIQLLKRLESLKEKKPESEFNKEIAKFGKEQTITWLTEKLKKHITGDDYTRGLTLVSIDACKLVFDYSNMVGRKYREIIPTDIASINKYNQFTYNADVCISKSYAFGIIQDKDETTYKNTSFLNIYTTDEDLVSNINFAMKHLTSFCNGTNASKNTASTANNSNSKKIEDPNVDNTFDLIDIETIMELLERQKIKEFKTIFNCFTLASMEVKVLDKGVYKDLLHSAESNVRWDKKDTIINKTKGIEFTTFKFIKKPEQIFFDNTEQFCYYNKLVDATSHLEVIEELKTKKFIITTKKSGTAIEERWEKEG